MKDLTEKQLEILNIIKNYIAENGYSPSFREIGKIAKINSSATIWTHINNLKQKGYITYIKGTNRTIRVLEG